MKRLRKALGTAAEMGAEVASLTRGRYPGFVGARRPKALRGEIPVFVYHSIDAAEFEADLKFLAGNGYRTLDCDAFVEALAGRRPMPNRAVLLTIDDGRASVWSHGFPLLRRYGMTAVVFLIPGYIRDADGVRPTTDDRPEGLASADPDLMTWPEIAAMARSGLVDFQSHTLFHHKVPASDRVLGFVGPRDRTAPFDIPFATGDEPGEEDSALGYPLFETTSRMSGAAAFRPDAGLIADLRDAARGRFDAPGWRDRLHGVVEERRKAGLPIGTSEAPDETHAAMRHSLAEARRIIEARLPGHRVRHLCLPYTLGSEAAVAAARETGHASTFWGLLPERRGNRAGDDPFRSVRLKSDYLRRLPGQGRRSMAAILLAKVQRRVSGRAVY
ncbi:polysaccharide deacetylase family protein [Jannaschia rubra]|uniref:polysaccharide deacetylase family protein n=1 Tax=Jannaschia rubra TaxID=282197 RepID=UPI0024920F48|nr:polysaccharide deacetylase family protein [Jannaschia rubra]